MAAYGDGGWRYGVQHGAFCRSVVRAVVAVGGVDVSTGDCRQAVKFDEDSGTKKEASNVKKMLRLRLFSWKRNLEKAQD